MKTPRIRIKSASILLVISIILVSCATTGPKVTKEEMKQAREALNARFFEASQIWLPRIYRIGYELLASHVPEYFESEPKFNFIGIGVGELKDYARTYYGIDKKVRGVLVLGVYPGSTAEATDVRSGDVITHVDGKKVKSLGRYFSRIKKADGVSVQLRLVRNGKKLEQVVPVEKVFYNAQFFLEPTPDFHATSAWSKINVGIGAIRYSQNEDELAFIMGHELAHTTRKHATKKLGASVGTGVAYGTVAGIIGAFTFPGVGSLVTAPFEGVTNAAISRAYEREADYFGMMHAFHAGFDVKNGARIMSRLGSDAPGFEVFSHMFSSHPEHAERFLRLEKVVEEFRTQYPDRFPLQASVDWELRVPMKEGESLEDAVAKLLEEETNKREKNVDENRGEAVKVELEEKQQKETTHVRVVTIQETAPFPVAADVPAT
jgi:hypothetical protein